MSFIPKTRSGKLLLALSAAVVIIAAVFLWLGMQNPVLAPTVCNYNDPDKSYIKKDKGGCVINFLCIQGRQAFSDECGCGCKVLDAPLSLSYSNLDYDFSFSYLERDVFKTDAGYQYVTNNSLARVDLPQSDFAGTNLGEASFIIGASGDKKVVGVCLKPALEESAKTSIETINGTEMKVFDGVGVGVGNIYETKSYRAVKNGVCYEATLLLHSGNIGNYPPGAVKEFDHEKFLNGLKEILNTLKIGDKTIIQGGKTLDLSSQGLSQIPSYVFSKTDIEELDLSGNRLAGMLPAEIGNLKNLKVLNASNNKMTGVPAEIGRFSNLEVLDLSNNKLTGLPYELGNLKNLKIFKLSGNDYSREDLWAIRKNLSASVVIE